jgi:CRISPR type III-B/RAMP module RAMP protein Cmr6
MNLPLPADTLAVLTDEATVLKASNLGLLFNKYVFAWTSHWATDERVGDKKVNKRTEFLKRIVEEASLYRKSGNTYVSALYSRQNAILTGLRNSGWHIESFQLITDSRLIIGLGSESVIETGLTLHPLYGFPYMTGSGLKGLARAYAETVDGTAPSDLRKVFGSQDKDPRSAALNRQGKVFFLDALPGSFPNVELDVMNPHYSEYYQGDKPPADYLNPVPITFLTVAPEQTFTFAVLSQDEALARKAKEWLIGGLTELGAGGKTNVGYGYFKMLDSEKITGIERATGLPIKPSDLL